MNDVQKIESTLTPEEMEIVYYHRNTIASGKVGKDPEGRPVTVYYNTIQVPAGPYKGKFVTVPGYFDGSIHDDEESLWKRWRQEISSGMWPTYNDSETADSRAKHIHGIMDIERDMADPSIVLYGGTR